jgi:CheY-like chemotaxis protein
MNLQSLLVCSDDRTVRLLRNVLGELDIAVEHCADSLAAKRKLAEKRFEAVIIDCKERGDFKLLQGIRSDEQNRRSMTVAIIDSHANLHGVFDKGANFVVYKPISSEKAKSSFRAARALMQRERRRATRLRVNIPAYFRFEGGDGEQANISGLSEGGLSVRFSGTAQKRSGVIGFCFALPDTALVVEATGRLAWHDSRHRAGIEFATIPEASRRSLKDWIQAQSGEKHDPPIACTLKALSVCGCFLQTQSAFPVNTNVELLLRAADSTVRTRGKVDFMDPELGMGIEFVGRRLEDRRRMEELMQRIESNPETLAEVQVEPEGLDWKDASDQTATPEVEVGDALVELLKAAPTLSRDEFLHSLEQHHLTPAKETRSNSAQRREPRIAVSREVEIWINEGVEVAQGHATSMVDVSHHGARIDHTSLNLHPGDPVHLVSGDHDIRFRVIWVGEPGTPQEGQVGLQKMDD